MDQAALTDLLDELIATWENEVVEFKQANNDYDTDKIGEYFSALSNEANLRGAERAPERAKGPQNLVVVGSSPTRPTTRNSVVARRVVPSGQSLAQGL